MIKNKDNGFIGKAVISLIATLGTLALFMGTSGVSADVKEAPKLDLDANQTKVQTVSDEEMKTHDGQAQDSKKHLGKNSQKLKELRLQMRKHLITSLSLK